MDSFLRYILKITALLQLPKNVHIILGNESCDLDSTVSALSLAYLMHETQNRLEDSVALPLLNVKKEEFDLRVENCYVLDKMGVNRSTLFYRDTLDMKDLINKHKVNVTLVDHHVLALGQEYLKPYVVGIFDHRPLDLNANWPDAVDTKMKLVGSCATLITNEIISNDSSVMCRSLAEILYNTIIFDTIGLSPTAGKVKELDFEMIKKLEGFLQIQQPDHQTLFKELWAEHNNVSHLTPKQLLMKDLKFIRTILIPGLPMLVKDYLKLPNVPDALNQFCTERNATVIILMGLEAKGGGIERDLGFYSLETGSKLLSFIVDNLKQNEVLRLEEEEENSLEKVRYFTQDFHPSRKQLFPLVKDLLMQYDKCKE